MYCLFEKTENKQKEAGLAQFKKKQFEFIYIIKFSHFLGPWCSGKLLRPVN